MAGDFNQVVAEVCQRYAAVGKPANWNLANQPVFGFRSMAIRRLVTNLVDNAASYGRGQIEVSTRYDESSVILTVRDEGPGIRSTDPNNLIKAFARENIARGSQLGAGLGPSIVDRIAKTHGGSLAVAVTIPVSQ